MSAYKIYRVEFSNPVKVARNNRKINRTLGIMIVISVPFILMLLPLSRIDANIISMFVLLMPFLLVIYIVLKSKSRNRKLKCIGNIEFTRSGITKTIGDFCTKFDYESIESIRLMKHMPALTVFESKSGYFTYILSINFNDSRSEKLIVSDLPAGKGKSVSITDTVNTINRMHFAYQLPTGKRPG